MASPRDVTPLLDDWIRGNPAALNQLLPVVYRELRRIAREEDACVVDVSPATAKREWPIANSWHWRELGLESRN